LIGKVGGRTKVSLDRRVTTKNLNYRQVTITLKVCTVPTLNLVDDLNNEPWSTTLLLRNDDGALGLLLAETRGQCCACAKNTGVHLHTSDEAQLVLIEVKLDFTTNDNDTLVG